MYSINNIYQGGATANSMKTYGCSSNDGKAQKPGHQYHVPRTVNSAAFKLQAFTDLSAYPKYDTLEDILGSAEEVIKTGTSPLTQSPPTTRSSSNALDDSSYWNNGIDPIPIDSDTLQVVNGIKLGSHWKPDDDTCDLLKSLWMSTSTSRNATIIADTTGSTGSGVASIVSSSATADSGVVSVPSYESTANDASTSSSFKQEQWNERYQELVKYKEDHGHVLVPHGWSVNRPLAQWVKRQRYQYKLRLAGRHTTLTDERYQMLVDLGFVWNAHDAMWEEKYTELVEYEKAHGNCNVPSTYPPNKPLSVWVRCQRRNYKLFVKQQGFGIDSRLQQQNNAKRNCGGSTAGTGGMTMERVHKLQSLGFSFNPRNL